MILANIGATKPKSVNLALETVMEFKNKDNSADLKFLDNVQHFLDKLKNVLGTNKTSRRFDKKKNNIQFVDFVKSAIDILKTYDDDDLEDVFDVFDDEIRKYHYRGCKFHELVKDRNLRRFVGDKLSDIKDKPAAQLRNTLDQALQTIDDAKFGGGQIEFLDYVNSLYRPDSSNKLKTFLNNLQSYAIKSKRANLDLIQIVRNGLRSVIFDHISGLNPNVRRELKIKLETSWNDTNHQNRVNHREWTISYPAFGNNLNKHATDMRRENNTGKGAKTMIEKELDISEMSSEEEHLPTTFQKKPKPSYSKHNKGLVNVKYVIPKEFKSNHNKRASLITMYPEDITMSTHNRVKTKYITQAKLQTILKENIKEKRTQNMDESLSLNNEMKGYEYNETPEHMIISEHETAINVERAGISFSEYHNRHKHNYKSQRHSRKQTTKQFIRHRTKATKSIQKQATHKKFRKYIPKLTSPFSEEGMSIERFEINRRTMTNTENETSVQDDMKMNVLRRINNLEKQMEEVKSKIDTRLTSVNDNALSVTETEFEPLEFWKGTNSNKIMNKAPVTSYSSSKSPSTMNTKPSSKTVKHNSTQHKSKNVKTTKSQAVFRRISNDSNDIVKYNKSVNATNDIHINNTGNVENENVTNVGKNYRILTNSSQSYDEVTTADDDLDKILKKYNISDVQHSPTKLDIHKYLADAVIPGDDAKAKEIKDIIESDLKKVLQVTAKPYEENELDDPFQDIDAALDLIK